MTNTRETIEAPKNENDFIKLTEKETRLRIISKPVLWRQDRKMVDTKNKPINTREKQPDIWEMNKFWQKQRPQQFWLVAVYDVNEKKVKCRTITQSIIKNAIIWLRDDSDYWPEFDKYDLKIKQVKDWDKIKYNVIAAPKSELSDEAKQIIKDTPYNLDLIFEWKYPISDYEPVFGDN